jgi:hypothetical protein
MDKAYYALTDVGPFVKGQVVVLDDQDGWARTGYLRELVNPAPGRPGWEPIMTRVVLSPEE